MKTNDERIQDILNHLDTLSYIRPEEIPVSYTHLAKKQEHSES